ncbi:hypothetical protein SEA_BRAXOADDIE_8 [Rhodococcus phage Braxoaddie]|nr:hypothetical protein SEA_BRAXOADDIE_8 [Rhodococcus phage Braxoaddie]
MADQHHHQDVRTTEIVGDGQYVNPGAELARRAEIDQAATPILNDDANLASWAEEVAATATTEKVVIPDGEPWVIQHPGDALSVTGDPIRVGFEVTGDDGSKQLFVGNARFETHGGVTSVTMDEAEEVHVEVATPQAHNVVVGDQDPSRIAAAEAVADAFRRGFESGTFDAEHRLTPKTVEAKLLADAAKTVNGDRQDKYGDAEDSFQVIADFWNTYLSAKYRGVTLISPFDVAMMMDLMKTARLTQTPTHRDSLVDKAGYVALGERTLRRSITDGVAG